MTSQNTPVQAFVLLSGGLDSTTALRMAEEQHDWHNIHAISFQYGQKHSVEITAAREIAAMYEIDHKIVQMPEDVYKGGFSALIPSDDREMPHETYEELADSFGVSPTYVPYRNGTFLSIATAVATAYITGLESHVGYAKPKGHQAEVWFGAHGEDAHNWAYPDCTPEFIGAMANAIWVGSYHRVRLITPLQWMMKHEIVRMGLELDAPYDMTISCYEGRIPSCGVCPTCVARLHAFARNDAVDPIPYSPEAIRVDFEAARRAGNANGEQQKKAYHEGWRLERERDSTDYIASVAGDADPHLQES